jgi:uncharacterized protein YndB with AHSA1/START domain
MSADRFECDTLIAAPPERVWSVVVAPGFWVADEASVAGTVAKAGESMVAKNPEYGDFPVRVEKVDPQTYVAYRWASAFPGDELRDDNSTLVEFTVAGEGDGTRLTVVESGFASLAGSEELRAKAAADNADGWPKVFEAVKKRAQSPA